MMDLLNYPINNFYFTSITAIPYAPIPNISYVTEFIISI